MADLSPPTRELRRGVGVVEPGVRDAVRSGLGFAVAGLLFLFVGDVWIGTCTGSIAQAAGCGVPQKAVLALGAPVILLVGGVWSFARSHRTRAAGAVRPAWLAAGWSLVALAGVSGFLSLPSLPF